jgi:hypothetical protein
VRHRATIAATIASGSGWSDELGMAILLLVVALAIAWSRYGGRVADFHRAARGLALALATSAVLVVLAVLAWKNNWMFGVWAFGFALIPAAGALRVTANMRLRRRLLAAPGDQVYSNLATVEQPRLASAPSAPLPPLLFEEITLASLGPRFRPPVHHAAHFLWRGMAAIFTVRIPGRVRTLFLWVFADRPSDQLILAAQHVGPVYLLRGGGILAERPLGVLLGDADEHIEESEQEVMDRLDGFERVRMRMIFARHSMLCSDRVWTLAFSKLVERTTCVVMDLRRYEPARVGCEYELGVLIDRVPLGSVAFVVESAANRQEVRALIERCWAHMATDSPNRQPGQAARLFVAQHIDEDIRKNSSPAYLPAQSERLALQRLLVDLAARRPARGLPPPAGLPPPERVT